MVAPARYFRWVAVRARFGVAAFFLENRTWPTAAPGFPPMVPPLKLLRGLSLPALLAAASLVAGLPHPAPGEIDEPFRASRTLALARLAVDVPPHPLHLGFDHGRGTSAGASASRPAALTCSPGWSHCFGGNSASPSHCTS